MEKPVMNNRPLINAINAGEFDSHDGDWSGHHIAYKMGFDECWQQIKQSDILGDILTDKQKSDIVNSLNKIKEDIIQLENPTGMQLLFFYEELKRKADFGYNFVKCAEMCSRIQSGNEIEIK